MTKKNVFNSFAKGLFVYTLLATSVNADVITGTDLNSASSEQSSISALYSANRGTNGGGDQSLQFGDVLQGTPYNDLIVGGLGIDIIFGGEGDDFIIGGTEDFNSFNRDRAFGQEGEDSFIWSPGDGNDFFDGGPGLDVVFLTLIGESKDDNGKSAGAPFFSVNPPSKTGSQDFDGIFEQSLGMPMINVADGPGFCEVIERDEENTQGLEELGLDHLVRFTLRGPRAAFDAADASIDPTTLDDGLRIALHLKNVEFLVCAGKTAGTIRILDLRVIPAQEIDITNLPARAASLLQ
jgi:hypothetical protein